MKHSTASARQPAGGLDESAWGEVTVDDPFVMVSNDLAGATTSGNALSVTFSQCSVVLEDPNSPLSKACFASLYVPITPTERGVVSGVSLTVRGSIIKSPGSRAVLLIDAAGQYRVMEFPFGQQASRLLEIGQTLNLTPALLEGEVRCSITLSLIVQRLSADEHVMLSVNTLDATAHFDSLAPASSG